MKISEIRNKNNHELSDLLIDFKKEAFNLRFQKVSGQLVNTSRIRLVKKLIAKIKTIQNEKDSSVVGVKNA
jgi:large subunit ribosomal protein L29